MERLLRPAGVRPTRIGLAAFAQIWLHAVADRTATNRASYYWQLTYSIAIINVNQVSREEDKNGIMKYGL